MNPGGQPSNRQRDRIGITRSLFVRQRDRVDPVRLAVNVTGSIIADRGITAYTLFTVKDPSQTPLTLAVTINGADLVMEVDTGAAASIISEITFHRLWADAAARPSLKKTNMRLRTYTGEMLVIKGSISVSVCCRSVRALLDLLVVAGTGPSLMGRNWLHKLNLHYRCFTQGRTMMYMSC